MNTKNPTQDWTNQITYCTRCGSTIFWDDFARPQMLKLSDKDMSVCMQEGCNLLFMNVPAQCCDKKELYLVMLGLQKIGIPEEEAKLLALKMSKNVAAA